MLEEGATVVRVEGADAWIATQTRSACSHCGSAGQCGSGLIASLFKPRTNLLRIDNTLGADVGDRVVIGIPDAVLVRASGVAYLLPLLCLLAVATLMETLVPAGILGEGTKALIAIAGLVAGLVLTHGLTRGSGTGQRYRPCMLRHEDMGPLAVELKI